MAGIKEKINRRRKLVIFGLVGLLGGALVLSMVFSFFSLLKESKPYQPQEIPKQILPEEDWKTAMEYQIKELQSRQEKIEKSLEEIKELLKQKQHEESIKVEEEKKPREELPPIQIKVNEPILSPPPPPPPPPRQTGQVSGQQQRKEIPMIREFKPEEKKEGKEVSKKEEEKEQLYIPLGFSKGVLLSGLDAPTLLYGKQNPHPVLMLILDKQILANNRKLNLKGCFALGSGFGELSSERAYIQLVKVSCISKDGKVYEKKVEGVVVDDDGKVGLKGRVVSRFGAVLAKQFMAGILEGVARILQASYTTVQISPIGTASTINPDDATKVAVASGFGSAARRLAEFYMNLAKEYFPVIEIPAGRKLTLLFYGGEKLEETDTYKPSLP